MKKLLSEIIFSILSGKDYRTFVLATINERFIAKTQELISDIFAYKKKNRNWIEKLLEDTKNKLGKDNKFKLLWYGGLNDKTVKNMTGGTSTKEICLELGKKNIESFRLLLNSFENSQYQLKVIIKKKNEVVELNEIESIIFINIISAMKLTIQGGAWSEVGKQTEKSLLFVIFKFLAIPEEDYILIFDEMKKKELVGNREIDAIVFSKDKKPLTIELKLLGIGNPEIGDEALARKVDLFLIDRLTEMMINEAKQIGVKVIEFRQERALKELYEFLRLKNVNCKKPEVLSERKLKSRVIEIINQWNEKSEGIKVVKKLKELTA
ncbi:MAG: CfrBI family restriction endonuclease [Candidatus Omnitrophica bacterium]|nr:CfrBI family restriction endonuclease [Candidatus Omnitrophota bacterium]